jgi:voltage-gated potassium channel
MVCSYDTIRRRRPTSILAWVVLFCFCHLQRCFVHSFQPSTSAFRSKCPGGFFKQHRIRLDSLSQFAITDNNAIDVGGEGTSADEQFLDERESEAQNTTDFGQEPGASEYCYVNLEDVSAPFVSREDSESTFIEYTDDGLVLPAGPIGQSKEIIANFLTGPSVEIGIAFVVLLNSLLVALSTLDSLSHFLPYIRGAELVIGTIFFADFVARWFSSSRDTFGFVLDPQFALDILVVLLPLLVSITPVTIWLPFLPSFLSQPSGLFNLQLLRVLRLQRFLQDLDTFERFIEQVLGKTNVNTNIVQDFQLQLARVVLSLFTLISVATGLIYTAEYTVNPNINNYFDALYFGLTTLTTVGFGDVIPVTSQGRLIVCGSIVFGVAVVPAQTASLFEALLDRENMKNGRTSSSSGKSSNNRRDARIGTKKSSSASEPDDSVLALDTTMTCSRCGASFHWSCASYCYKCGEKIIQ